MQPNEKPSPNINYFGSHALKIKKKPISFVQIAIYISTLSMLIQMNMKKLQMVQNHENWNAKDVTKSHGHAKDVTIIMCTNP